MSSFGLRTRSVLVSAAALLAVAGLAQAQGFDSGSDGSEGALVFPADAGTIVFDPATFSPALDPDGDGTYHFTSITVGLNTTVRLGSNVLGQGRPVVWLASGDVLIAGTLDLNGQPGHDNTDPRIPAEAGAGGYTGGTGNDLANATQWGNGPGGGSTDAPTSSHGAGGGHATPGGAGTNGAGAVYSNPFLLPLLGGSGGGGGHNVGGTNSGGGGGGGGALLIASNTQIQLDGAIQADGGNGSTVAFAHGGGGSGGAVRLMAPRLLGTGTISATGGGGLGVNAGGFGRIRLEAFRHEGPSSVTPGPSVASPGLVFLPPTAPLVRLVTIDGVAVSVDPSGSFVVPDTVVTASGAVTLAIEASNIPVGTVIEVTIRPETGTPVTVNATALSGTLATSTASATVTLPAGFTRLFLQANWTP